MLHRLLFPLGLARRRPLQQQVVGAGTAAAAATAVACPSTSPVVHTGVSTSRRWQNTTVGAIAAFAGVPSSGSLAPATGFSTVIDEETGEFEIVGTNTGATVQGVHGVPETVELADVKNKFHDAVFNRCTLCDERLAGVWDGHCTYVSHQARLGVVERVLTGMAGPPDAVVDKWWGRLNECNEPGTNPRIPGMSSDIGDDRRKRMVYLLAWFVENRVMKHSLCVWEASTQQFTGRGAEFERLEMIGDNVVKCVIFDRIYTAFPPEDGGVSAKLSWIQQAIDSNEGLLRLFDYLELDRIIGSALSNSKFKSDVVECLFGEIQSLLWALSDPGPCPSTEFDALDVTAGTPVLRALLEHSFYELADVCVLWVLEGSVKAAMPVLRQAYHPPPDENAHQRGRRRGRGRGRKKSRSSAEDEAAGDDDLLKYVLRPPLTSEPGRSQSARGGSGVVVLRGLSALARERSKANEAFERVQPLQDLSAVPRRLGAQDVSTGGQLAVRLAAVCAPTSPAAGGHGLSAEANDELARTVGERLAAVAETDRAMQLGAEYLMPLTEGAKGELAALGGATEEVAASRPQTAVAELIGEYDALSAAFNIRRQDIAAQCRAAVGHLVASQEAQAPDELLVGRAYRQKLAPSVDSDEQQPQSPRPETPVVSATLPMVSSCISSDFSRMRPPIRDAHVLPVRPALSMTSAPVAEEDSMAEGMEWRDAAENQMWLAAAGDAPPVQREDAERLPFEDAARETIWELRGEADTSAGHELTARQARRATPVHTRARLVVADGAESRPRSAGYRRMLAAGLTEVQAPPKSPTVWPDPRNPRPHETVFELALKLEGALTTDGPWSSRMAMK